MTVEIECGSHYCFREDEPCEWSEMHHYDDEGNHWCPTGFEMCNVHLGIRKAEGRCLLWGEKPNGD
jgi:hypothetical protein